MRRSGSRRSDQGRVWEDISIAAQRLEAPSPTRAMAAIFDRHRTTIEDFVRSFRAVDHQVGALFAVCGRVSGFDLFDRPTTLRTMFAKLVRSWAVEALGCRPTDRRPHGRGRAASFLRSTLEAEVDRYPAVGLGTDIRLAGEGLIGAGLVHEDCLVHLAVFATEHEVRGGARRDGRGMASARTRRSAHRRR